MYRAYGLPFVIGLSLLLNDPPAKMLSDGWSTAPSLNLTAPHWSTDWGQPGRHPITRKQETAPDVRVAQCNRLLRRRC
jgi:hypothetical protein